MLPIEVASLAAFRKVSPDQLVRVAKAGRSDTVRGGALVFQSGQPCGEVALIADGCIRLCRHDEQGVEVTTGILTTGGFLGIASLSIGRAPVHPDSAIALNPTRLLWLPTDLVIDLAASSPAFLSYLLRQLSNRVNDTYLLGDIMARGSVSERIMFVLHHVISPDTPGQASQAAQRLSCRLSHDDLARLIGANRVTVTRTLHALQADRRIELRRGHVHRIRREGVSAASDASCVLNGHHA